MQAEFDDDYPLSAPGGVEDAENWAEEKEEGFAKAEYIVIKEEASGEIDFIILKQQGSIESKYHYVPVKHEDFGESSTGEIAARSE